MKKKSITGIIVVALFIIGIIAALIVYKKVQTMPEKLQIEEEPETVILSADENPFGIETVSYTHLTLPTNSLV